MKLLHPGAGLMPQVVRAIFENGVFRPLDPLELQEHQQVRLTVEQAVPHKAADDSGQSADPLGGIRVSTGIPDLAEHFDDYRFGRRRP